MKIIDKLISIFNPIHSIPPSTKKTIRQLDLLDDVWVKDGDILYKGWVFDKTRRHITVCYDDFDYKFRITGQEYVVEQENKTLYCNKPNELQK